MNKKNTNEASFDEIFKQNLENASTSVPEGVWEGISSSIGSSAAVGLGVKAAIWIKSAVIIGSISAIVIVGYQMNKEESLPEQVEIKGSETLILPENSVQVESNEAELVTEAPEKETINTETKVAIKPLKKTIKESKSMASSEKNQNQSVQLTFPVQMNNGANQIEWAPSEVLDDTKPAHLDAIIQESSELQSGELNESTYKVDSSEIFIPNVFTPNGDGINDSYLIKIIDEEKVEIIIFDMDLNVLFRTNNKYQGWNFLLPNGSPAPAGKYLVKVIYKFKGQPEKIKTVKLSIIK